MLYLIQQPRWSKPVVLNAVSIRSPQPPERLPTTEMTRPFSDFTDILFQPSDPSLAYIMLGLRDADFIKYIDRFELS